MKKEAHGYYPGISPVEFGKSYVHPALTGPVPKYTGDYDRKWMRGQKNNKDRVTNDLGRKTFCELIPKDGGTSRYVWLSKRDLEYFKGKHESWEVKPADYPISGVPSNEGKGGIGTSSSKDKGYCKNGRNLSSKWYEAATILERIKREG